MTLHATTGRTTAAQADFTTHFLTSKDGTRLGYRQIGHGLGLVIVHGSMSTGYFHTQLARLLADTFTVYLPDRRGFGLSAADSGGFGADYSIDKNVEDLDALLTATGAHNLCGISVGGIISLRAALSLPAIQKLAVYEPPLFTDNTIPKAVMARFDNELAQGKVAAALTTATKGVPLMPDMFTRIPRWLMEFMTSRLMAQEDKLPASDYVTFRQIAPTLHYDGQVIIEMSGKQPSFSTITVPVFLLGGSRSSTFLKHALDTVEKVLPGVKRIELPGLDHGSSWNSDKR
ncbi:MAG TPA: alpha/beta hydrolase, partial [Phototrophicaceae bacterium]|nr:alpha/beta hydrolase [Phototrophicaceae bacterium]